MDYLVQGIKIPVIHREFFQQKDGSLVDFSEVRTIHSSGTENIAV
jgi:hypothetical protein